jgi:lauroyl/myristoyl acyltransferase
METQKYDPLNPLPKGMIGKIIRLNDKDRTKIVEVLLANLAGGKSEEETQKIVNDIVGQITRYTQNMQNAMSSGKPGKNFRKVRRGSKRFK